MAQFASGDAPSSLMPRGTTSTPMPPASPPPPTGTTIACTSGSWARISRASRPPLPAITWSSSNADTNTRPGSAAARWRAAASASSYVAPRDLDARAQRRDAGALDLGRLRRHQHGRVDAEGTGRQRDAQAVVAGRGGDHARLGVAAGPQRQRGDAGGRAAQLERSRPLQVLELQPDVGAGSPAQRRAPGPGASRGSACGRAPRPRRP